MDATLIRRLRAGWPAAVACMFTLAPVHAPRAAGDWALCAPSAFPPPPTADRQSSTIRSDTARVREDGVSVAEGNVVLSTPDRTITSHRMEYDPETRQAQASGDVTVREREVFLEGNRLRTDLETGESVLEEARYNHPDSHGRGDAERIENDLRITTITDGSYTTCDPGSGVWRLEAASIELDHESSTGTARHARLRLFELPVLYTPWISFPIGNERKTGLLAPSFETSDNTGTSLTLPLYLNLAPNYDATLRPRFTSRRGEVLGGQFRYLTERGAGTLEGEALPEDRITGDSRSLLSFRHRHRLAPGLDSRLEYARASDIDYLRDLGTGLSVANTNHLRSLAELTYEIPGWWFETQVEQLQSLVNEPSPGDPYRVVPRAALESRFPERNRRPNFDVSGEFARFEHHSKEVAIGTRFDLRPSATFPLRSSFGYLLARTTLHYTGYGLNGVRENVSDSPSRTIPSFSLDSGLFFDREVTFADRRFTQTLEPRLFYLRVPYRNQDHLPIFDAGSYTSGYDHMFRENRFSGTDRIGDADRLAMALDTRLLLDSGREVFSARLGQMRHFRDRQVRLCSTATDRVRGVPYCPDPGSANPGDRWTSAWIAGIRARPHRAFTTGGAVEHDRDGSRKRRLSLDLRYHPSPERILNFGYRQYPVTTRTAGQVQESVEAVAETLTLSMHRDLGRHVRAFGNASYAFEQDTFIEFYTGLEYASCCWSVRMIGQRYLSGDGSGHERSVLLQWELRGLTGFESGSGRTSPRPIPGYRNLF